MAGLPADYYIKQMNERLSALISFEVHARMLVWDTEIVPCVTPALRSSFGYIPSPKQNGLFMQQPFPLQSFLLTVDAPR